MSFVEFLRDPPAEPVCRCGHLVDSHYLGIGRRRCRWCECDSMKTTDAQAEGSGVGSSPTT